MPFFVIMKVKTDLTNIILESRFMQVPKQYEIRVSKVQEKYKLHYQFINANTIFYPHFCFSGQSNVFVLTLMAVMVQHQKKANVPENVLVTATKLVVEVIETQCTKQNVSWKLKWKECEYVTELSCPEYTFSP